MQKIIEELQSRLIFNKFLEWIFKTNFADILDGRGPFTVLAPVDEAFESLNAEELRKIEADPEVLSEIIGQHIIIGSLNTAEINDMDELPTMANQTLAVEMHNEGLIVGAAKIIQPDIECSNGIIQVIDTVLFP